MGDIQNECSTKLLNSLIWHYDSIVKLEKLIQKDLQAKIRLAICNANLTASDNKHVCRMWSEATDTAVREASQFAAKKPANPESRKQPHSPGHLNPETRSLLLEVEKLKSRVAHFETEFRRPKYPQGGEGMWIHSRPEERPLPQQRPIPSQRRTHRIIKHATSRRRKYRQRHRLHRESTICIDSDCIINLSNSTLSFTEQKLLCRGLSLIPKPESMYIPKRPIFWHE